MYTLHRDREPMLPSATIVAERMFLYLSVILFTGEGSLAKPPPTRQTPPPPSETATAADGTYPSGMHSCFLFVPIPVPCSVNEPLDHETQVLSTVLSLTHRHGHRRQQTATYHSLCQNRGNNCGHPEQRKILKLTSDKIDLHC